MGAQDDSYSRWLLIARLVIVGCVLFAVVLGVVAWLASQNGSPDEDTGATLVVLIALAGVLVSGGLAVREIGARLFANPEMYGVFTAAGSGVVFLAILEGFILSIMLKSLTPFIGIFVLALVCWGLMWPRRSVWAGWAERREATLSASSVA